MLLRDFITCDGLSLSDYFYYGNYEKPDECDSLQSSALWDFVAAAWAEPEEPENKIGYDDVFAHYFVKEYGRWFKLSRRNLARWKRKNPELYEAIVEQSKGMFA